MDKDKSTQIPARIAVVRAIPQPGHKRRWCGLELWVEDRAKRPHPEEKHGLPWPDTEVKVRVVDKPAPFDPNANGGAPIEISPATLVMLEKDDRIAVRVLDGDGGDPAETIRAKAANAKLEEEIAELRRQLAEESERAKALQTSSQQQAEELGAKLAASEAELATVRAQLSARGSRK
jgi:hypothetical protein